MAPQTGANGVLPVSALQKNAPTSAPRGPKAAQPRLKLVLRRLPPGLTKNEFENYLGEEWKLGAGKVDWLLYKKGKISKDLAKPSRPSRAYLHVTSPSYVPALGEYIRLTSFNDAAKSTQDSVLIGPPSLEYASYHRVPGGKRKQDNRQGTIDQDQEFKDFLESLTNPIPKPAATDGDGSKEEKVTTTPLIEALREKKANKDKPQTKASGKHGRGESKEDSAEKKILKGKDAAAGSSDKNRRASKAEKAAAAKEAVKVLNKEASSARDATASASTEKIAGVAPERKRGNTSIAKSMLQRDLGIIPAPNRRRGTKREVTPASQDTAHAHDVAAGKQKMKETSVPPTGAMTASEKTVVASIKKERPSRAERRAFKASLADKTNTKNVGEKTEATVKAPASSAPAPTILKKPQSGQSPVAPKGPTASRAPPTEPLASRAPASQPPAKPEPSTASTPASAPTGRQAFLKHANPSQGITEPLIEEALKVFGTIEKVEIDKRKGFAYVDFLEAEGLQKAIAASPIKVAQGAVQVLERKEKVARPRSGPHGPPAGPATRGRGGFAGRGGRGGRGGGRGGGPTTAPPAGEAQSVAPSAAPTPLAVPPSASADVAT